MSSSTFLANNTPRPLLHTQRKSVSAHPVWANTFFGPQAILGSDCTSTPSPGLISRRLQIWNPCFRALQPSLGQTQLGCPSPRCRPLLTCSRRLCWNRENQPEGSPPAEPQDPEAASCHLPAVSSAPSPLGTRRHGWWKECHEITVHRGSVGRDAETVQNGPNHVFCLKNISLRS